MKLLTKTSHYYILYTIPILILSSVIFYFFLLNEIGESNETILKSRVRVIEGYIKNENQVLLNVLESNNELTVSEIDKNVIIEPKIKDTLIFSKLEKEEIAYKTLEVNSFINGKNYKIKVLKSTIEVDELLEVVVAAFITLLLLLFFIIFFINLRISKKIWQPFYTSLHFIKNFNVTTAENNKLELSDIEEFNELNSSINQMTAKMISDYQNQKKFAENASHEFQTPIAIIKGKVDLLLQTKNLNEESLKLLIAIDDTTNRLSRINKSLLLLSKIENRQYVTTENVLLFPLIEKLITINEDLILDKNLKIKVEEKEEFYLNMNTELCYILFNNLLQNAIRHTIENGIIAISITKKRFSISNTAGLNPLNNEIIFERFEKQSSHSNSIGLGLAIVKEIAEIYIINISYSYEDQKHVFSLYQIT